MFRSLQIQCRAIVLLAAFASLTPVVQAFAENSATDSSERILLLEFSSPQCPACQKISPLLSEFKAKQYPIQKIDLNSENAKSLFEKYSIKSTPTFVMLLDGREVDRFVSQGESVAVLKPQLLRMFNQTVASRNQATPASATNSRLTDPQSATDESLSNGSEAKKSSPDLTNPPLTNQPTSEKTTTEPSKTSPTNSDESPLIRGQSSGLNSASRSALASVPASPQSSSSLNSPVSQGSDASIANGINDYYFPQGKQNLLPPATSSVRIRIANSNSATEKGTGTIIHSNQSGQNREALVLTCGHLFRESQGNGKVEVDVFDPNSGRATTVEGVCVYFDDEIDIGFVGIPLPFDVRPVPLVPLEYLAKPGDRAVSVGCSSGENPTLLEHQILSTSQSSFRPKDPNSGKKPFHYLQVSNAPVQGRSGGGLFVAGDSGYYLLGVCNAGDAQTNDGYFLPSSVVYETLLSAPNLNFVYNDLILQNDKNKFDVAETASSPFNAESLQHQNNPNGSPGDGSQNFAAVADMNSTLAENSSNSVRPVRYENEIAGQNPQGRNVAPTSFETSRSNATLPPETNGSLDGDSLLNAGLDELRKRQLEGAEIICIVNWPTQTENGRPNDRESEVIRLPKRNN